MALKLKRATKDDIPALVAIYFTTFKSPIVFALLPDTPAVREWYRAGLEDDFHHPWTHAYKVVAAAGSDGDEEIVAFAKWSAPHPFDTASSTGTEPQWPADGDPALAARVVGTANRVRRQLLGDEEHWYLAVIATLPQHQRKGAASLLMAELCRQADEAGQAAYVEASPLGKATYERFGFETRDSFTTMIKGEPYVDCCMVRKARGA